MKIRINDLARELEVKSKEILEVLPKVGVTEKKTHSSSIEEDEAEKVKKYYAGQHGHSTKAAKVADEPKPKIDLSKISKPGDVLKAITSLKEHAAHPAPARPVAKPPVEAPKPAAPAKAVVVKPAAPVEKPAAPAAPPAAEKPAYVPRMITPQSVARPSAVVIPPSKVEKPAAPPAEIAKPTAPAPRSRT